MSNQHSVPPVDASANNSVDFPVDASSSINQFVEKSLQSRVLLWLSYALVGWQLSAYDLLWFLLVAIALTGFTMANNSTPWLDGLLGYLPQILVVSLSLSLLIILIVILPILVNILLIPILTTGLVWQEMQLQGKDSQEIGRMVVKIAASGLIVGEVVDLLFLSSPK